MSELRRLSEFTRLYPIQRNYFSSHRITNKLVKKMCKSEMKNNKVKKDSNRGSQRYF